ncbi:MAG: adenylyl-sulfate kinase [Eubacteriales bacterium]|nr:adenylyl-sulfate kinase [Eubacteriales bacterium]
MNSLLKFITCGSVDDGKSTLIGHMLYDAKLLFADQERALELDSRVGSRGGAIDYSLLLDGLMAEREQGITIDVAYRYFTTENRSFIVADTPGHEEYTRNMAVGASFADLAVILVDATQGVLLQTRRHTRICALMGIRHFVFAVNKMDLIHYDENRFRKIEKEIRKLVAEYDYETMKILPVSATEGDNVTVKSGKMPWYHGESLLTYLENVEVHHSEENEGFTMPVQRVCRPDHTFRGFQGQIETGKVCVGDEITSLPSGETAIVERIIDAGKEVQESESGHAVTIAIDREMDISRGCVLVKAASPVQGTMFTARILWMDDNYLVEGKNYYLKLGTMLVPATVMNIKCKIDVNTGNEVRADVIYKNEIADCDIAVSDKIVYDEFNKNQALGSLILIDRVTNMTSACGVVMHALRRSENVVWQQLDITRDIRAQQKGQKPVTIWLTGLSGAGKSTIANQLEKRLVALGRHTMLLDGDNVRMGLNKNLGFTEKDRIENIRRIAEVAKLMNDAGLIVITSFISPFRQDRRNARDIIGNDSFMEIYVSTSLEECERRDVKGLYRKARMGEIPNFTGINSEYEAPEQPELIVDTENRTVDECAQAILELIKDRIG